MLRSELWLRPLRKRGKRVACWSPRKEASKYPATQPELILLDILLPGISGIEAARRIRRVSRRSQIIFVSQHDSEHMARAALETGGRGYVVKSDAGRELLKAISAVRQGLLITTTKFRIARSAATGGVGQTKKEWSGPRDLSGPRTNGRFVV